MSAVFWAVHSSLVHILPLSISSWTTSLNSGGPLRHCEGKVLLKGSAVAASGRSFLGGPHFVGVVQQSAHARLQIMSEASMDSAAFCSTDTRH